MNRKGSTATKVTAKTFDRLKEQFLADIGMISKFASIPKIWNQTVVKYVSVQNWIQEVEGTKQTLIAGIDDCHNNWLPAQVIYGGKIPSVCLMLHFPPLAYNTYN